MDVTELERKHVGKRATVTYVDSGDSFTGEIIDLTHANRPAPRSSAIIDVSGQLMVIMSIAESVRGRAEISILPD